MSTLLMKVQQYSMVGLARGKTKEKVASEQLAIVDW
jgi:hypothetical protein